MNGVQWSRSENESGVQEPKAGDIERKALRELRLPHVNRKYKEYHNQYLTPYPIMHIGIDSFQQGLQRR